MYKTVRKGDASLQYTILPQTDQFSSGSTTTTSGVGNSGKSAKSRCVKYTMGSMMVLIIIACVSTPFLMNQNDHNLFAGTMLAMGRVGHSQPVRGNSSRTQQQQQQPKDVTFARNRNRIGNPSVPYSSTEEEPRRRDSSRETTPMSPLRPDPREFATDVTSEDSLTTPTPTVQPPFSTTLEQQQQRREQQEREDEERASTSTTAPTTTIGTTSTESTGTSSSVPKKTKMPRVTLKLRENETIPQMYMKAGIASYKKGNITTSVLAHNLSLERLIFKTSEGTIKPWPQKWFFADPSSDFQWKGTNQMSVTIYVILAGLAALASVSMVLMFYVQRKASRRQRQNIEEPESEGHEEDKSTLLGAEGQDAEEKE